MAEVHSSPVLSWIVKNQIHHIAVYHVISIMACDIKFRRPISNIRSVYAATCLTLRVHKLQSRLLGHGNLLSLKTIASGQNPSN